MRYFYLFFIYEYSFFTVYSLPLVFNSLEGSFFFFIFDYTFSSLYSIPFSFDFLTNCFFGSSELESVEVYVELAEAGGDWILDKRWDYYLIDYDGTREYPITPLKSWPTLSEWDIEKLRAEGLIATEEELRYAGIIPTERSEALKRIIIETRPQYPGDIYMDILTFPIKTFQVEKKQVNWILITLGF